MTREQDWRIHEYMGNDLTGYKWNFEFGESNVICKEYEDGSRVDLRCIPHYSTTWEGAGLVMDWLSAHHKHVVIRHLSWGEYGVEIDGSDDEKLIYAERFPQALAKAVETYIAAMEER